MSWNNCLCKRNIIKHKINVMSTKEIRTKIEKSLDSTSNQQLQLAWLVLKELGNRQQFEETDDDKQLLDEKIAEGLQQLDNGEGSDFGQFLNELEVKYANKK